MKEQNRKTQLLESAPIRRALLAMGLPTMMGMTISAVYNLADAYFVGGLGTSQMSAISVAYPLGQIVVGVGLLFGNGAASYIARLLGSEQRKKADQTASTALYGSLCTGVFLIICALIFLKPILRFFGATESILPYALTYSRIYTASSIFNVLNVTMNSIVTSEGAAKNAMYAMMTGAALNIILDPMFIYLLKLGVAGAAAATAISQMISALIYLCYILRGNSLFHFRIKECCFSAEIMSEIFKIGVPTLLFQVLTSLSISLINMQADAYGDSVIAAMGAVTRIVSLVTLMVFGFIKGFQPIAGYNYGAGNFERLKSSVRLSVLWTTGFCVIVGILLMAFAGFIISQFTSSDAQMISAGEKALRASGLSIMLFGYHTVYSSLFLALGKGKAGLFLGACRQGICFLPIILILPKIIGLNGILYAQPAADIAAAAITAVMSIYLTRELAAERTMRLQNGGKSASSHSQK